MLSDPSSIAGLHFVKAVEYISHRGVLVVKVIALRDRTRWYLPFKIRDINDLSLRFYFVFEQHRVAIARAVLAAE